MDLSAGRWPVYAKPPSQSDVCPFRRHQADLLFLPHDKVGRVTYKYALTLVDIASRFKAARPLTSKRADEVAKAFANIYRTGPLSWPKTLMVDDGHEFKGEVSTLLGKHGVNIRRAQPGHHRSQAFVESFNRVLAERLFRKQAHEELGSGRDNREWVSTLPAVVADMNATPTRLTNLPPVEKKPPARGTVSDWCDGLHRNQRRGPEGHRASPRNRPVVDT